MAALVPAGRIPNIAFGLLPLPKGAEAAYSSSTGAAGAQVQVSIAAVAAKRCHITGFTVTTAPPSGSSPLGALVTLTDGNWTQNWQLTETVSAGGWLDKEFLYPLFATGPNTAVTLTLPAVTGGGAGAVELHGYLL